MPGDLPGVDSNEDKEVWEYVFEVGVGSSEGGVCGGGLGSSSLQIPGMVHIGRMPGK